MIRATALGRSALTLAAALALPACALNQEGVAPPSNTFFYPASAILDRSGSWLYVTNSNADLRYNDGTLVMVNVGATTVPYPLPNDPNNVIYGAAAERAGGPWDACPRGDYVNTPQPTSGPSHFCCWDNIDVNILNCDERAYIPGANSVKIGSFSAGMARQQRTCALDQAGNTCPGCMPIDGDDRLFLSVRGDTSLTYVDVSLETPPVFKCNDADSGSFVACDAAHRLTGGTPGLASVSPDPNPPTIPLPNEPYALAIDDRDGLLFIGHLTGDTSHPYTGGYSLFDIAPFGQEPLAAPRFIAPFPSPFPPNANGLLGITTLTVPDPTQPTVIFATSRYATEVAGLQASAVCRPTTGEAQRDIVASGNGQYYSTSLAGGETRGIAFADLTVANDQGVQQPTQRPFVLQRVPPALVEFDGTIPTNVLETCSNPTFLFKNDAGIGDRLFVNCYDTGEIYVFDPGVPRLEATFQVGRGPAGMVLPVDPTTGLANNKASTAYVIGFGDNNISVVDLDPGSPTEYHVIQRIGFPSVVPR